MGGRKVIPPYVAAVIARKYPAGPAPWIYNTWEPFERKIDKATVRQLVESAGRMGFDIFTIDDGWQKEYGANVVDERAFPGGLDDIRQEIEAKHMRLGLWVPVAAIDRSTDAYQAAPRVGVPRRHGTAEDDGHDGGIEGRDVPGDAVSQGGRGADQGPDPAVPPGLREARPDDDLQHVRRGAGLPCDRPRACDLGRVARPHLRRPGRPHEGGVRGVPRREDRPDLRSVGPEAHD